MSQLGTTIANRVSLSSFDDAYTVHTPGEAIELDNP